MKTITRLLALCLFLFCSAITAHSQNIPEEGSVGLSASFQGNQTNLMVPIWATEDIVIAPLFGIVHEAENFTSFNLGVKPRFYRSMGSNFANYFGFQGILQHTSPEIGDDRTDFVLGVNGGGEYYLNNRFSLGIEGQLNWLLRDSNENRLSTGVALTGSYYF